MGSFLLLSQAQPSFPWPAPALSAGREESGPVRSPMSRNLLTHAAGRARRRENIGDRPNDPPLENRYAFRREILPQADAQLGCRVQEPFKVAHSTSGKVMQHH